MINEGENLFVYGTLKQDIEHPMRDLLARFAEFVGTAAFQGKLYRVNEYPGAIRSDDLQDVVYGEIYALKEPAAVLSTLDEYEDYEPGSPETSLYRREMTDITGADGRSMRAWIYLYNKSVEGLEAIPSGTYAAVK